MKKISRKAARFVLTCLGLFVILICIACATQNAMFFAAGMVIAIVGLLVRSRKIRCPYCGELKRIKMMDLLKWSAPIQVECPICGKMIEYDE